MSLFDPVVVAAKFVGGSPVAAGALPLNTSKVEVVCCPLYSARIQTFTPLHPFVATVTLVAPAAALLTYQIPTRLDAPLLAVPAFTHTLLLSSDGVIPEAFEVVAHPITSIFPEVTVIAVSVDPHPPFVPFVDTDWT